jgi:hypothetical protein
MLPSVQMELLLPQHQLMDRLSFSKSICTKMKPQDVSTSGNHMVANQLHPCFSWTITGRFANYSRFKKANQFFFNSLFR